MSQMSDKYKVYIKKIPAHYAYSLEYDINSYEDFFDLNTGECFLQELSDRVERDNPGVKVPPIPEDYNYFTHEAGKTVRFPAHVHYFDMVTGLGNDTDEYRFVTVPEVMAATIEHVGYYDDVGVAYELLYEWIAANGYEVSGDGRSSFIHGPWDTVDRSDYLVEVQIPVKKIS